MCSSDLNYSQTYTCKVYRSTSASGSFSVIATTAENAISDNNVSEGRTYYYKVKAFDSSGNSSDFSETVSVSLQSTPDKVKGPNKPVITSVTASRSGQLTINWKVNSHPTCAPQQASSYLYPILKAAAPPRLTTWERTPPPSAFPMVCGLIRTDG